jgi:hypothetical protein
VRIKAAAETVMLEAQRTKAAEQRVASHDAKKRAAKSARSTLK